MANLPVITGFGGINAAGRSAGHHAYRRMVLDSLPANKAKSTRLSLAALTGKLRFEGGQWLASNGETVELDTFLSSISDQLDEQTLIRELEQNLFDPNHLLFHRKTSVASSDGDSLQFELSKKHLPDPLPLGWSVSDSEDRSSNKLAITATENFDVLLQCYRKSSVHSAGQLPSGFDPAALYPSRNHPRGLQLTVYAASEAINSLGLEWDELKQKVSPDQVCVYAGSGMGQMDYNGYGGMLQARLIGKKVSSKQLALGYAEMPADFINAYLIGNLGTTGTSVAACATFLYNLRQGIRDIQTGSHRIAIIGTSEAPLAPEIFDGFATMGALADDAALRELDGLSPEQMPDFRRACRPFDHNVGFTLAESAQFVVLMDDALAIEMGANIYGAVNEVFINADGHKKSIASPGLGNYISMAKAVAATRNLIGNEALQQRTFVQAHGTGTPQNRKTESHIINEIAKSFNIKDWPVAAIKSYLGHSLASSAGDQLTASLGVWSDGIIPGILTIRGVADDVHCSHLNFLQSHKEVGNEGIDAVIINSKGFGGNNASASIIGPHIAIKMLSKRYSAEEIKSYKKRNEAVLESAQKTDEQALAGTNSIIYKFDHNVLGRESIAIDDSKIKVSGIDKEISLQLNNSYKDMCD
ncbi:MAG TPA: beta-ketoacyl synthase [Porticoccaceae bacterium]|nr:beta-ketoacyl synthase [Gammaproteobacteria bacterium]HIL61751.1 beta-ketoacyl synthase [Porticoccaceae bacterium]